MYRTSLFRPLLLCLPAVSAPENFTTLALIDDECTNRRLAESRRGGPRAGAREVVLYNSASFRHPAHPIDDIYKHTCNADEYTGQPHLPNAWLLDPARSAHPPDDRCGAGANEPPMAGTWKHRRRPRALANLDAIRRAAAASLGASQCRQSPPRHGVRLAARAAHPRARRRPVPARRAQLHQRVHSHEPLQHNGQKHELAGLRSVRPPLSA
jgi:hypothetical protein